MVPHARPERSVLFLASGGAWRLQRRFPGTEYPQVPPVAPHLAAGGNAARAPAATHHATPAADAGGRALPALLSRNDGLGAGRHRSDAAVPGRALRAGGGELPDFDCPADAGAAAAR